MNRFPFAAVAALLLLSACFPKHPELPQLERSPERLLQSVERHRREFVSLTALANVTIRKGSGKRSFDTVGIVIDGTERIRIEAYGPLGQSLTALVWNGSDLLMRMSPDEGVTRAGPERLQRLLGRGMEPSALCAVLSGNIPDIGARTEARLFCTETNECTLEIRSGDLLDRVLASLPDNGDPVVHAYERYRSGSLLYAARFDDIRDLSGYRMPMRISLENPGDHIGLIVAYSDVTVNVPLDPGAFLLDGDPDTAAGK